MARSRKTKPENEDEAAAKSDPAAENAERLDAEGDRPAADDEPGAETTAEPTKDLSSDATEKAPEEEATSEVKVADPKPAAPEDVSGATDPERPEAWGDEVTEREAPMTSAPGDGAASDETSRDQPYGSERADDGEADAASESPDVGGLGGESQGGSGEGPPPEGDPPAAAPAPAARSGGGAVIPMIFGGIVAALIGFLFARYMDDMARQEAVGPTPEENAAALSDQETRLEEMQTVLENLAARDASGEISAAVDPLRGEVEGAVSELSSRLDGISGELAALGERVETIAMRPVATGIEADAFDEALTEFRSELSAAIEQADAEISQARAEAERISSEAFRAEQEAIARAAWSQVRAALEAGTPYAEPLAEAAGVLEVEVPEPVAQNAEEGVPALETLQSSFPEAARDALGASIRAETGDDPLDRLTAFLRVQSGARSLTPKEGNDPDAILSRAEAAVLSGDLETALSEISALPEAGQSAMSDWRAAAETRLSAISAAADLAQQIEQK